MSLTWPRKLCCRPFKTGTPEQFAARRSKERPAMSGCSATVCVGLLLLLTHCALVNSQVTSFGKEFFFAFPNSPQHIEVIISTTSTKNVTVVVSTLLEWTETVSVTSLQSATVRLPPQLQGQGVELADKGVYVLASEPVSVFGVSQSLSAVDTFLALPRDQLGENYFVFSSRENTQFMIVAVEDYTVVNITLPPASSPDKAVQINYGGVLYPAGDTLSITLNRLQTFHVNSFVYQYSGTNIRSSKPVAVLSGNRLARFDQTSASNYLVEMLLPVGLWGTKFYAPHSPNARGSDLDVYQVLTFEEGTEVKFGDETQGFTPFAPGIPFIKKVPAYKFQTITANNPIMVTLFSHPNTMESSAMMMLVPEKLLGNVYSWGTPEGLPGKGNFINYVSVIIDEKKVSKLVLDGQFNLPWKFSTKSFEGDAGKANVWLEVPYRGSHTLTHQDVDVNFYAYLSGYFNETSKILPNPVYMSPAGIGTGHHIHRCSITGDPHLITFSHQTASLGIPCAYYVTKVRLINTFNINGLDHQGEIYVEVLGGNSKRTVNFRYYVSVCCIRVKMGSHSNTYCTSEFLIQNGTNWVSESAETMENRVWVKYNATTNMASMGITYTTFLVTFRPVNRRQSNFQRLKPGITVEVGSYGLVENNDIQFPDTMCSTVDDVDSIAKFAAKEKIKLQFAGVFAIMQSLAGNIPEGDQHEMCPDFASAINTCNSQTRTKALNSCLHLVRFPSYLRCFEKANDTAIAAFFNCINAYCTPSLTYCNIMERYGKLCYKLLYLMDWSICGRLG